jgi:hypothetical protein
MLQGGRVLTEYPTGPLGEYSQSTAVWACSCSNQGLCNMLQEHMAAGNALMTCRSKKPRAAMTCHRARRLLASRARHAQHPTQHPTQPRVGWACAPCCHPTVRPTEAVLAASHNTTTRAPSRPATAESHQVTQHVHGTPSQNTSTTGESRAPRKTKADACKGSTASRANAVEFCAQTCSLNNRVCGGPRQLPNPA